MSVEQENTIWDSFYEKFKFSPSVHPENFPSILEPHPSTTYEIKEKYSDEEVEDLNAKVQEAIKSCSTINERICVLDWQHQCYWFYPHRHFQEWLVPVLPDGDYYIFLAEDFRFGIFGHPWEWTSCVWGGNLISFLENSKPKIWETTKRKNN